MKPKILFAVDDFDSGDVQAIAAAAADWADWERLPDRAPEAEYARKAAEADVIIGWPKPEWLSEGRAQVLLVPSHGFDQYQGLGLEARPGFTLCNARGAYTTSVAEHCVALMLALARCLPQAARGMAARQWTGWETAPHYRELAGSQACVVGLGAIGTEIARRLLGLGLRVSGVEIRDIPPLPGLERIYKPEQLREAVAEADHVVAAVFGGPATARMIDGEVFDAMRLGAFFYNISRGSVVDETALIERLRRGRLAGAGLDVFEQEPLPPDSPLWGMDNVLITPHVAGSSDRWSARLRDQVIANLRNYRDGKPLHNVVMPPET